MSVVENNQVSAVSSAQIIENKKDEKEVINTFSIVYWWNRAWERSYITIFLVISISLACNTWNINREKYDGSRIIHENHFNLSFYLKKKNKGPCGWTSAKFGLYQNRTCSGNILIPLRERFGCYLSECGSPKEILCDEKGKGWISRNIFSSRCQNQHHIRHICCRPLSYLCTWQGKWTSIKSLQNINCQFEPDDECGKLVCNNGKHKITTDSIGRCRSVRINGKLGNASCGQIDFADNSDGWYKKVDAYSVFNS